MDARKKLLSDFAKLVLAARKKDDLRDAYPEDPMFKNMSNKDMNPEVYNLRRKVMEFIYEVKNFVNLPRITVRVVNNTKPGDEARVLGVGRYGDNIIWITEEAINLPQFDLRTIVYHELLHSVFSVRHDESCPLMKAHHTPLPKEKVIERFLYWVKKTKPELIKSK